MKKYEDMNDNEEISDKELIISGSLIIVFFVVVGGIAIWVWLKNFGVI